MSTNIHSQQAYQNIVASGKAGIQQNLILNHLIIHGSKTRKQIAKEMNIETSTISARVNRLKNLNIVTDTKTIVCPISKKTVGLVEVM